MDLGTVSLFKPPRRCRSYVHLVPPTRNHLPYLTGGVGRLFEKIKKDEAVLPFDCEKYTNSDGSFCPAHGMPLLVDRYEYVEVIGQGQSAILIRAKDTFQGGRDIAIKILHTHYSILGSQEVSCHQSLNAADPHGFSPILRLLSTFCVGRHFCLVFELLNCVSLSTLFQQKTSPQERLRCIRKVALRLINAVGFLQSQNVIHADLKPDNLRLSQEGELSSLKVVDFGNAIHCIHNELSLYYEDFELQTLLYRAPEVIFGVMFGIEVDMWSVGCILAELYLGRPLFQGGSIEIILTEMQALLGPLPREIFQRGKFFQTFEHFTKHGVKPVAINNVMRQLDCYDFPFVDFLLRLLKFDPANRMTVGEAAEHPFLAAELGLKYFQMKPSYDSSASYANTFVTPETYCHLQKHLRWNGTSDLSPPQSTLQNLEALTYPRALKFLPRQIEQVCDRGVVSKPDMISQGGVKEAEKPMLKRKSVDRPKTLVIHKGGISQLTIKTESVEFGEAMTEVNVSLEVGPGVEISRTGERSNERLGLDSVDRDFALKDHRIANSLLSDSNENAKVVGDCCNHKQRRFGIDHINKMSNTERMPASDRLVLGEVHYGFLASELQTAKVLPRALEGKDCARLNNLKQNSTAVRMVVQSEQEAGERSLDKGETGRTDLRLLEAVSSGKSPGNQNHSNLELESLQNVDDDRNESTKCSDIVELHSQSVLEGSNLVSSQYSSRQSSQDEVQKRNDSISTKDTASKPEATVCSSQSDNVTEIPNHNRATAAIIESAPRKSSIVTDGSPQIADESASKIISVDILGGDVSQNAITLTSNIHGIWQKLSQKKPTICSNALSSVSDKMNTSVEKSPTKIPVRGTNGIAKQTPTHFFNIPRQSSDCKLDRRGMLKKSVRDPTEGIKGEEVEVLEDVVEGGIESCPERPVSSGVLSSGRLSVGGGGEAEERMSSPGCVRLQSSSLNKRPQRKSQLDNTFIIDDIPVVGLTPVTIPKRRARQTERTQLSKAVEIELSLDSSSCKKRDKNTSNWLDVTFARPPNPCKDFNLEQTRQHESLSSSVSLVTANSELPLSITSSWKKAPKTSNCLDVTFAGSPNSRKNTPNPRSTNHETSHNFISSSNYPASNPQKLYLPVAVSKKSLKSPGLGSSVTSANMPEICELESAKVTQELSRSDGRPSLPRKRRKLESGSDNRSLVLTTEPKSPCVNYVTYNADSSNVDCVASEKGKKPQPISGSKLLVKGRHVANRNSKHIPGDYLLNKTFQVDEPPVVVKEQRTRYRCQHREQVSSPGGAVGLQANKSDRHKSFEFVGKCLSPKRNVLWCYPEKRKGTYDEEGSDSGESVRSGYTVNRLSSSVMLVNVKSPNPHSAAAVCLLSDDDEDDDEVVTLTP